jgi:hypothetical protein
MLLIMPLTTVLAAVESSGRPTDLMAVNRTPRPTPQVTPTEGPGGGPDCSNTSTGLIPLNDLAGGSYQGFPGGLYTNGNTAPQAHLQEGLAAGQSITPLNELGQPDNEGKIVFLSVGMSNASQEFTRFKRNARDQTAEDVVLVNGARAGYDAFRIADPNSSYWPFLDNRLEKKGLSPLQVQVIWLKQATIGETAEFPQDAQKLQGYLRDIVLIIENRFPNIQAIYFSSRIYGGYAGIDSSSPEPWAYQSAFAVKWLIRAQMTGSDPALAYQNSPWLAWGPYMWADGLAPRSDGFVWKCDDFGDDGLHPSTAGEIKVANRLLDFFENHPTTQWFSP